MKCKDLSIGDKVGTFHRPGKIGEVVKTQPKGRPISRYVKWPDGKITRWVDGAKFNDSADLYLITEND